MESGPHSVRILGEANATTFHDCFVYGVGWDRKDWTYAFSVDLDYILEWLEPTSSSSGHYRFMVAEARLVFRDAKEMVVSLDWSGMRMGDSLTYEDAQIDDIVVVGTRAPKVGAPERQFKINFHFPSGSISLWSTGYEVHLLGEPVVSDTQQLVNRPHPKS
jgi:hypothetical protein